MIELFLTIDEILAIYHSLQFSIDNGLADEYQNTEILFETKEKFNQLLAEQEIK